MDTPQSPWPLTLAAPPAAIRRELWQIFDAAAEAHRDKARGFSGWAKLLLVALVPVCVLAAMADSWMAWLLAGALAIAWLSVLGAGGSALALATADTVWRPVFAQLLPDFAPGQRLHLMFDDRDTAEATRAFRTATSPYSGAHKAHHRHCFLTLRGFTADGGLLALEVQRRVKLKGSSAIRVRFQLRGRLRPGPGRTTEGLVGTSLAEGLKIQRGSQAPEITFLGEFDAFDQAVAGLSTLMAATRGGPGRA